MGKGRSGGLAMTFLGRWPPLVNRAHVALFVYAVSW